MKRVRRLGIVGVGLLGGRSDWRCAGRDSPKRSSGLAAPRRIWTPRSNGAVSIGPRARPRCWQGPICSSWRRRSARWPSGHGRSWRIWRRMPSSRMLAVPRPSWCGTARRPWRTALAFVGSSPDRGQGDLGGCRGPRPICSQGHDACLRQSPRPTRMLFSRCALSGKRSGWTCRRCPLKSTTASSVSPAISLTSRPGPWPDRWRGVEEGVRIPCASRAHRSTT